MYKRKTHYIIEQSLDKTMLLYLRTFNITFSIPSFCLKIIGIIKASVLFTYKDVFLLQVISVVSESSLGSSSIIKTKQKKTSLVKFSQWSVGYSSIEAAACLHRYRSI